MYKLLIVDDEKNIRLGIQAMIKRQFSGEFESFLAANGLEALEIMDSNKIDILITDIKMPQMDGIQLIKQINTKSIKPEILILSGFDDFEYTREAIRNSVMDYLLKPINREELFKAIQYFIGKIKSSNERINKQLKESRSIQLNYIFINPNIKEEDIERKFVKLGLEQFSNGFFIGLVYNYKREDAEQFLQRVKGVLSNISQDKAEDFLCFYDKDDNVVVLTSCESVFILLKEYLNNKNYLMGISDKQADFKKVKQGYEQALFSLKSHLIFPKSQIIFHKDINNSQDTDNLPINLLNKISNMLGTDRDQEIRKNLLEAINYETISQQGIKYMEKLNAAINTIILDNAYKRLGEESIEIFKLYNKVGDIYNFENFYEYYYAIEDLILRLHEYIKQIKSIYSEQKYMEKALKYIEENFSKDLNLAVVSNYISLNYSYFSHMFKENTGICFVDYLKKIRIEKAKQLLTESEYKIFEISEMVGYKNSKQFARVFRDLEGVSPKEYQIKSELF